MNFRNAKGKVKKRYWVIGAVVALYVIGRLGGNSDEAGSKTAGAIQAEETAKPTATPVKELTPEQKAAKAKAEKAAEVQKQYDAAQKAKEKAKKERQDRIDAAFSPWDGKCATLVEMVKDNMEDPGSFKHVETRYWDQGNTIRIKMTFRGKNGFGGVVTNGVTADWDLTTDMITIVEYTE
jgi:hypothetical protein